jgi:adenylate cyclase
MADASARAVRTAIEMQRRVRALNAKWKGEGKAAFEIGIGINTGDVVFGNIGSSKAMGLTVIGDHVNQAQRLQAYAKAGEILVSEAVAGEVGENRFRYERIGEIEVKHKKVVAYRIRTE